ncbi:MAG: acyl-CoA dehydrogenase family protein [Desulfobacterales bacterium]|nr:MAG: acyl-CoA dehydrogenase family protein [Desulfobacterales bacterium]
MDFKLSRENAMIKDAIYDWVSKECTRDVISDMDERNEFPAKLAKKLSQLGFCGMMIPEEIGGEGCNVLGACIVTETIAAAYPALARWYTGPTFYGGAVISALGSEHQKQTYLPKCAAGKLAVALAHTETDADPDPARIQTSAKKRGDQFRVSGEKQYISNADKADLLLVAAQQENSDPEDQAFSFFCINRQTPGMTIEPVEKLGYKGTNFCRVRIDAVAIGKDDILGGPDKLGRGDQQWQQILDIALLAVTSEAVGLAQGAFDYTLNYARQRVQFGQVIGTFNVIRNMLAELAYDIEAARLLLYRAAWLADQQQPFSREISMAKCQASETARRAAMDGLQIYGGYGYTMEYDIQRYVRDAMSLTTAGASLESLKARIGAAYGLS